MYCEIQKNKNETGEIREFETDEILVIGEKYPSTFIWEKRELCL